MSTATAELTDLDALIAADRRVKLAGKVWKVPGDPPTGWLLLFRQLTKKFDTDSGDADELEVVAEVRDAVVDLFLIRQPDQETAICEAVDILGIGALVGAVNTIYASETGTAPEAEADPTPPAAAGTPSTTRPRARTRSRSSSSSAS